MRPRLSSGSRREGGRVVDDCNVELMIDKTGDAATLDVGFEGDGSLTCSLYPDDALAVIRVSGLDKVWDAAVKLHEKWSLYDPLLDSSKYKDVVDAISSLCRAVEESSES